MRDLKVALVMLIAMAFGVNAYATAFASSCDCLDSVPTQVVKADMQCHDVDGPDSASDAETSHQDSMPGCDTCASGHCEVSSQVPLFNNPGTNLIPEDGRHGLSAKVPKPPLSSGIDNPPKHTS
ncbi:MAG: hypothetical protein OXC38_00805 [Gammaproteobacteria bacterium]|nr:hypothetical protein [Gammaproteobacteria bacterium]